MPELRHNVPARKIQNASRMLGAPTVFLKCGKKVVKPDTNKTRIWRIEAMNAAHHNSWILEFRDEME